MHHYRTADLIFCLKGKKPHWFAKAIAWFTRHRSEKPTRVYHVAGFVSPGFVAEALSRVKTTDWCDWLDGHQAYEIWRHAELTESERRDAASYVIRQRGSYYGVVKIGLQAVDGLLGKFWGRGVFLARRLAFAERFPICSWLWAYAYDAVGQGFGGDPRRLSPDDMHDYVKKSSEWERVGKWV